MKRVFVLILFYCMSYSPTAPALAVECGTCWAECVIISPDPETGYQCLWTGKYYWRDCRLIKVTYFWLCSTGCYCV